ncbi:HD-like signal output (HDOD) domain, no enzymatic activity [Halopseudomonas litoralis]|uniref:HD-like signal output (HDOD) domain, no enzymatic activity n=1 Tax=Halopseudomonas litoralis TaxID=797277 RepID=A0A1H1LWR8_9GAMM|nr:HDOD domain-containing protein [Halopseudomonas litoralis]SDR78996.1 HD-like signal output (HDOD) domain, no enzymatic activity [Halopseudomonas litoralis]
MTDLALRVQEELIQAIDKDQLVLPTLPEVALRIREAAENPNVSISELVKEISADAALSARLIKVVNSPLLRSRQEITDLNMAVNRMGVVYTANLATGLAMAQLFQATTDVIDHKMREVWARSTEVAGISHVLCKHYTRLKSDQAMLAGLVHQIGVLPILSHAEDNSQLLSDPISLEQVIERIHPILGDRILAAWDFPQPLRHVPSQHLEFNRNPSTVDYADIVQVAMLQSLEGSDHPLAQRDWTDISSFNRLGLNPADDQDEEDLSAEMEAAMLLLG